MGGSWKVLDTSSCLIWAKTLQQPEDGPVKKSHKAIIGKSTVQAGDRHMGIVKGLEAILDYPQCLPHI